MIRPDLLVLFDIDGTLLDSRGAGRRTFHEAMLRLHPGSSLPDIEMAGRTDYGIWAEMMDAISPRPGSRFEDFAAIYVGLLRDALREQPPAVLPGADALCRAVAACGDLELALLTGNLLDGARAKLEAVDLWRLFLARRGTVVGGFGEGHADRDHLPPLALAAWRRLDPSAHARHAEAARSSAAVVLGDTPADIRCAHAHALPCIAVCTGPFRRAQLVAAGADAVVDDLSDTEAVLAAIRSFRR